MRCHICDRIMQEEEIFWNEETQTLDPCSVCIKEIQISEMKEMRELKKIREKKP